MSDLIVTPKGSFSVRPAAPEDAAALRRLRLEALAGQPQAFAADLALATAETAEDWARRIEGFAVDQQGAIYLAEAGQAPAGMCGIVRGNRPKTRHSATIWGVYVRAEWRGLHLAEALLLNCLGWAQGAGAVIVKLAVITSNTPAIRCYTRCGFSVYGIEPQAIFYQGSYYDELLMSHPV